MWGLLAIPFLAVMVVSDFRHRTVEIWTLAVTCLIIAYISIIESGIRAAMTNMLFNIPACILIGLCVLGYLKARGIRCRDAIGRGDIFFILALTPLFSIQEFLLFMTASSLFTLAAWAAYISISCRRKQEAVNGSIPLISGLGICLSIHLTAHALGLYRFISLDFIIV